MLANPNEITLFGGDFCQTQVEGTQKLVNSLKKNLPDQIIASSNACDPKRITPFESSSIHLKQLERDQMIASSNDHEPKQSCINNYTKDGTKSTYDYILKYPQVLFVPSLV